MHDLGRHRNYEKGRTSGRVKRVSVITGGVPSAGAILASVQDLEEYWETVFEDMPPILRTAIANNPRLRATLQTNIQAAHDYAAMIRRQVANGQLKEAAKTVVHFQQATVSFHNAAQRWDAVELGRWLASEAVKDAYAGVEAVGEWIAGLPDAIRNIGSGAVNLGKWLIGGAVALAVILAVKS